LVGRRKFAALVSLAAAATYESNITQCRTQTFYADALPGLVKI